AEELGDLGRQFGPVQSVIVLAQHIVDPIQLVRFHASGAYEDSRIAASVSNALLRDACWRVVATVRRAGYHAAILRNQRYGVDEPRHDVSFKKAGALAGLGAFGKSQLLIHRDWGPWIWLGAVATDAPLAPDSPIEYSPCSECSRCLQVCPKGALSENGIDREKCRGTRQISPMGWIGCEECLRACPVGVAPPRLGDDMWEHGRPRP
ncbi:MAG TPA: 4Fe-4S dicluster domain-containing protein, partial [Armatimonadota bacterium]|nr:4Fe-4S dicluster domain-containing protein [Armatimonadota bacterium]